MSDRNQYHELWQQKRNELPINGDIKADWSEMHNLLDQNMPVNSPGGGSANTGTQLAHLAKLKLLYVVAGLIAGVLITYLIMHHDNNPINKNHKSNKSAIRKDSTVIANTLQTPNSANQVRSIAADPSANNSNVDVRNNTTADLNRLIRAGKNVANTSKESNSRLNNSSGNRNRLLSAANSYNNEKHLDDYHGGSYHQSGNIDTKQSDPVSIGQRGADDSSPATKNQANDNSLQLLTPAPIPLTWEDIATNNPHQPKALANPFESARKLSTDKNTKASKNAADSKFDWGLLLGVNTNGSFTPKVRNTNFYGSFPVDISVGLFTTYNLSSYWAVGVQGRFLTPHTSVGSYTYTHSIEVESFTTVQTFQVNNSRKVYTIDVPLHLIYKAMPNVSLKAGPLLSIPIKDFNRVTFTQQTYSDTAQYVNAVKSTLKSVNYEKKLSYGASVGAGFSYKFLWLDATYNYYPQTQKASSTLGTFTTNTNNLQLTLGIKLNKSKK
jgi:hypothetical protein